MPLGKATPSGCRLGQGSVAITFDTRHTTHKILRCTSGLSQTVHPRWLHGILKQERISHVARRLGFGVEPGILAVATSIPDTITAALDLSTETPDPTHLVAPADADDARSPEQRQAPYRYWFTQMITGPRRIEERLTWFWHDHFATSIRKVNVPYLVYVQHITLRKHATGSFSDHLYEIAIDPAMLIYLDGVQNNAGAINENFGREVMEYRAPATDAPMRRWAAAVPWSVPEPRLRH